jgi:squalene cyclase
MWQLPRWFWFHPGKMWCHARMVYLPMGYVYCKRFTPDVEHDAVLKGLREELYIEKYETIDWDKHRQTCAEIDEYSPLNPVMKIAQDLLSYYEYFLPYLLPFKYLREKSLEFVMSYIHAEDKQTNYIDIGPVNKVLNMLAVWIESGGDSKNDKFLKHVARINDYLWVAEDGVKMQGFLKTFFFLNNFEMQKTIKIYMFVQFNSKNINKFKKLTYNNLIKIKKRLQWKSMLGHIFLWYFNFYFIFY